MTEEKQESADALTALRSEIERVNGVFIKRTSVVARTTIFVGKACESAFYGTLAFVGEDYGDAGWNAYSEPLIAAVEGSVSLPESISIRNVDYSFQEWSSPGFRLLPDGQAPVIVTFTLIQRTEKRKDLYADDVARLLLDAWKRPMLSAIREWATRVRNRRLAAAESIAANKVASAAREECKRRARERYKEQRDEARAKYDAEIAMIEDMESEWIVENQEELRSELWKRGAIDDGGYAFRGTVLSEAEEIWDRSIGETSDDE